MPLTIVKRKGRETLYVRGTVRGQGIFESTGTSDQKQAEAYRAKREAELWEESVYGKRAVVTFASAVTAYLEAEQRSATTLTHTERLLNHFGRRKVDSIGQSDLDHAYKAILTKGAEASGATKIRAVLTPLRAILEFSAVRGWCAKPAFERPRVAQTKMRFLRPDEATDLVNSAAKHVRPLLVFLIATGARMSEALELEWADVDLQGRRAVVWQKQGDERHIDLPPVVILALTGIGHRTGRVFRPVRSRRPAGAESGKEVGEGYYDTGRTGGGQIKSAWAYACKRAGLPGHDRVWTPNGERRPKRQFVPDLTPHAMRHTFATWHYCVHKDLLKLKEDGGWQTITMVTRYAKKMPDHYRTAIMAWLAYTDWPDIAGDVPNPCHNDVPNK
ncbi:prophage integrase [Ameyamaea chiangmaiensis NBRC 103196]|uniref:Site-specific integrase n=1 Tax=Ameyamaea chiangmaiensis TaxID=442969 RepID=A0A850P6A5_9PROT|nr:site-specific integrase [Ameyamaea chiangmaiensis]MBS4074629.1 site-specific integrase [Ameyamaea chiangmaiensis]NVN39384.1 site-specific integrase [Ameyamaea chiangmaiensis]GBQ64912.1 prophage integrase [Ameyamaea chiangmaiensis NBRC 103196]